MKTIQKGWYNADEGLGVILKKKNSNKLKLNIKNFKKIKFNDYATNFQRYLNLIEYNLYLNINFYLMFLICSCNNEIFL